MEMKSPPCPATTTTTTVRRNPPRRARLAPSPAIPLREPLCSPSLSRGILSTELPQSDINSDINSSTDPPSRSLSENLKIYLRIRPPIVQKSSRIVSESKNAWPKNPKVRPNPRPRAKKSSDICVQVNEDLCSVTVSAPQASQETKKVKSEVYEGFSRVFAFEASQNDVYSEMVRPLVEDFLKGKSGMLAAMGPSGSGKTHTVFGSVRDPGMVPLALRHIFREKENSQLSRVFYLSMLEISSERGKAERMIDLLHGGGDVYIQNWVLKGLQEAMICDAQQAESLIAQAMLKRATARTNSNFQSSRSQCIINIRCGHENSDEEIGWNERCAVLTIVDLAGAEREKKTGNQGARLNESNFINNTSMVFGQCLRALLEHQKNRSKPLPKHYKNSLLTRYMQNYLEGKKRMMLILTVRPGLDDYFDTSFLLRQASPFTKIKFQNLEETVSLPCNKRPNQAQLRAEQLKKMKVSNNASSLIDEGKFDRGFQFSKHKEIVENVVNNEHGQNFRDTDDDDFRKVRVSSDGFAGLSKQQKPSSEYLAEKTREYQILQGFSKALWTVLKQYKKKLEGVDMEICHLRDSLSDEKTKNLNLENELNSERLRADALESKLKELTSHCSCCTKASDNVSAATVHDSICILSHGQFAEYNKVSSAEVSSYSLQELEQIENEKKSIHLDIDSDETSTSLSEAEEPHYQIPEKLSESSNDAQDVKICEHVCAADVHSRCQELATNTDVQAWSCLEDSVVYTSLRRCASIQLTSVCVNSSQDSEHHVQNIVEDSRSPELKSKVLKSGSGLAILLECETSHTSKDYENPIDVKMEPTQTEDIETDDSSLVVENQLVSIAHSHTDVSSSETPLKDGIPSHMDVNNCDKEEGKEQLELPAEGKEDVSVSNSISMPNPTCSNSQQKEKKPKRRLLPASSMLLKDISLLDIKDGTEKPKGGRSGKKSAMDDENRTQGSLSLLNLLTGGKVER